ncbi:MAG: hypothetical protein AUJ97_08805 [Bacteroidetes bacterium CG2_30_32_10]|nr:MAG: hypothetical protein AUJ97_08805 [Bacteroidetes bacterium CG2_30_32_10]
MNKSTKGKVLKGVNYLELTPFSVYKHQVDEKGKVTVFVPKFTSKLWGKILMPLINRKFINVKFDELGSSTWLKINGKNKVGQICKDLEEKYGEKIKPAEELVTKFLSDLYFKKIINFNELIKEKNK